MKTNLIESIHHWRRYETPSMTPMKMEMDQSLLTGSIQMVMIDPDNVLVKELEDGLEVDETIIFD